MAATLREALRQLLPEWMVPSVYRVLDALPLTPNRKVDRAALGRLALPSTSSNVGEKALAADPRSAEGILAAIWCDVLDLRQVGLDDNFFDLGGHSLLLARVQPRLHTELGWDVGLVDLLRFPTIRDLVRQQQTGGAAAQPARPDAARRLAAQQQQTDSVAVIGLAGRFPGARNPDELWRNLVAGEESIRVLSEDEILASGVAPDALAAADYVKAGAPLADADLFAADYFGFAPREAETLDPQHRLFLECAVEALEDAGYDPARYDGAIGVYAGAGAATYLLNQLSNGRRFLDPGAAYPLMIGNDKDFLPTRVSYKLDLRGPSVSVQTACSTSLVAIHLACQSLLRGECDMALAGGVSIGVPQEGGYRYEEGLIFSPDGHCRAFDAKAGGTVRGNGLGIVMLKPLAQALADGDRVRAVIRGSAINNDGARKVGYTAPSVDRQAAVIAEALAVAGVEPAEISYVEAHGTGTPLGDPVEVEALSRAFRKGTTSTEFCALGSVKTNLGHLDAAAGVTALIKTVMALEHRQIPPSLHFETPNPQIDFANSPFYVARSLADWSPAAGTSNSTPNNTSNNTSSSTSSNTSSNTSNSAPSRKAGVSSFGIGGTNAHVILEEAPLTPPADTTRPRQLLILSAKSASALEATSERLAQHLVDHPDLDLADLADIAFTLKVGRGAWRHRRVVRCSNRQEALTALTQGTPGRRTATGTTVTTGTAPEGERRVAFLFPGQGSQFVGMGEDLYLHEPTYRAAVDRWAELFAPHLGLDLRSLLHPPEGQVEEAQRQLTTTRLAQPALFTVEIALAELWQEWGVLANGGMLGHSIGEYVAACLAGVFSHHEAAALVAERGKLMQSLPSGAMLSVGLPADQVTPYLGTDLALAAINAPALCTVSGPSEAITALASELTRRTVDHRLLVTSHAFHSAMTDPILERFADCLAGIDLQAPTQPFLSNVTGSWITAEEATDPAYWVRHLRHTVQFSSAVERLLAEPDVVLLEVGPGQALTSLARQHRPPSQLPEAQHREGHQQSYPLSAWPTLRHPKIAAQEEGSSDLDPLFAALGGLWLTGVDLDWAGFYRHQRRRRVALPTYPFERQRYWAEPAQGRFPKGTFTTETVGDGVLSPRARDWLHVPVWKQSPRPAAPRRPGWLERDSDWLVFLDDQGLGEALAERLAGAGRRVITVAAGEAFVGPADSAEDSAEGTAYTLRPGHQGDYTTLLHKLKTPPARILHLWSVSGPHLPTVAQALEHGFYSLLYLTQALADAGPPSENTATGQVKMVAVSDHMQQVTGEEALCPAKAALLGPCRGGPREISHLDYRSVDLGTIPAIDDGLVERLLGEFEHPAPATAAVAYRGMHRWVETWESIPVEDDLATADDTTDDDALDDDALDDDALDDDALDDSPLRRGGVYLITGGLGGLGLVMAEHLARKVAARLVLVGRTPLPEADGWDEWLAAHQQEDAISSKIRRLQSLEALGAEVMVLAADVSDRDQMTKAVDRARERFGPIHGVLHAAGVAGGGLIQLRTLEAAAKVLDPKIVGTLVLDKIFAEEAAAARPLDFLMLFSSITSVVVEIGQADYAAANAFLDAFARQRSAHRGLTLAVGWDTWREVGMALDSKLPAALHQLRQESLHTSLSTSQGIEAFDLVLRHPFPQVVVSRVDLAERLEHHVTTDLSTQLAELAGSSSGTANANNAQPNHARPALTTPYAAPESPLEKQLADLWQQLLGIEQVGIDDNFFELGGHSLMAPRLVAGIRQELGVELSLSALFNAPTVAGLALLLAAANGALESTPAPPPSLPSAVPAPAQRHQPFPLTPIQQAYLVGRTGAVDLGGVGSHWYQELESDDLDLGRFATAWRRLIARHDMLRTIFLPDGTQQILPQVPHYEIGLVDLRALKTAAAEVVLAQLRGELSHRVPPADRWPLIEIRAARLDEHRHRLFISFDFLVADAWSSRLLLGELHSLYQNPAAHLPPLELSFRDYVLALEALEGTAPRERAWEYWRSRLGTLPGGPELPLARDPASLRQQRFHRRTARLDKATWERLKQRTARAGLTPSGLLSAAFAEVLAVWSQGTRFTIVLTLFQRLPLHPQVNDLVGDFTATSLLVVEHRPKDPFQKRARRIQERLWQDLDHGLVSGVEVLRQLHRRQGGAARVTTPVVFTSTLDLGDLSPDGTAPMPGKEVFSISQTPQVLLDHQADEREGRLIFNWDAVEEVFPPGLLDDMFAAYCKLLHRLANDEDLWASPSLGLVPEAQLHQRAQINATAVPIEPQLLHIPFAQQAERQPERPALIAPGRVVNYGELDRRAEALGRRLRALNVRPGELVAVVMDKGWQQVVAVLGILRAGAAYLPIDASLPQERRSFLLADGGCRVAVTQPRFEMAFEWPPKVTPLTIADQVPELPPGDPVCGAAGVEDLAYVIYTSGSTGRPKGVAIEHHAAWNTIADINNRFRVGAEDRVLALSALSFDLSVFDIFGLLAVGGALVIPDPESAKDPAHWAELAAAHRVTLWNTVPASMGLLVDELRVRAVEIPLRVVMMSGDWIPVALPDRIRGLFPHAEVESLGGATEASIWSISHPIGAVDPSSPSIPYGRPLANQTFHVLDEALEPRPVWVPGQLMIGGVGLARCYWNDEEKTRSSFLVRPPQDVEHSASGTDGKAPCEPAPGERLYRTGDLGRYLPGGEIEFLGRTDFQVKIRGFRVELGEIEAVLSRHPTVHEAVVAVRADGAAEQRLVAYVVPEEESQEALAAEPVAEPAIEFWDALSTADHAPPIPHSLTPQAVSDERARLDHLAAAYITRTLRDMGVFTRPGETHTANGLTEHLKIEPRYHKLLDLWLGVLVEEGQLRIEKEHYTSPEGLPAVDLKAVWHEVDRGADGITDILNALRASGNSLAAMLRGEVHPLEVFFPEGEWQRAERIYAANRFVHQVSAATLSQLVTVWPQDRPLRILEIGAGTGGMTSFLLPTLPADRTRYTFTDISRYFTQQAQEKYAEYPFLDYGVLNIENDPIAQGFARHGYDVVVAADVLHGTRDLSETFAHVRSLLKPGGLLMLEESTRWERIYNISIGLIEGLTRFADRWRPSTPFVAPEVWRDAILSNGFEHFAVVPPAEHLKNHVLLALAPSTLAEAASLLPARAVDPAALRQHLAAELPEYMVPTEYVTLEALPLTGNGKVDRQALPAPGRAAPSARTEYAPPRSAAEKIVAGIWIEMLDIERAGLRDDFFALGGDSLLAVKLATRIRDTLKVDLPLRRLFDNPTVEGVVQQLTEHEAKPGQTEKIAQLLWKIKNLSPDELKAKLAQQRKQKRKE